MASKASQVTKKKGGGKSSKQVIDLDNDDFVDGGEEPVKKPAKKFNYFAAKNAAPSALGSKEIPVGKPDCLVGLTFVITGQLSSITREDTADLIKKYGGRVTSAVSGKTSYLIVGEEPGESKLNKAKSLKLPTLDEDSFFDFIRNRDSSSQPEVVTKKGGVKPKPDVKKDAVVSPTSDDVPRSKPVPTSGSKEIPQGKPGCLSGMTFVLTGELSSMDRADTTKLILYCGGRVTSAVSGKTTYLIVGDEAGASKVNKANSLGTEQMNEAEFYAFIRSFEDNKDNKDNTNVQTTDELAPTSSKPNPLSDEKPEFKKPAPKREVEPRSSQPASAKAVSELWVDKYKPQSLKEICGNNSNVKRLVEWLSDWEPRSQEERAVLISGKPGIGKTTSALLACKEAGYTPIELNASDSRSKRTMKDILEEFIDNRSISEFFKPVTKSKPRETKTAVILDEIDGMSGGDRGGVAEIIKYIKKTKIPIICICNDAKSTKVRSLANHCLKLAFTKPLLTSIKSRIDTIAKKEGLTLATNVIDKLHDMTGGDIRQMINLLSSWRLSKTHMSYDEGKSYSTSIKKNILLDPFTITTKFFRVSDYRSCSLADRMELYYHDFQLIPLFIQENYIRVRPNGITQIGDMQRAELELLDQLSRAADAICEGDLVDRSISLAQNWGLMPVHAAFSCAIPSFYMHGNLTGMIMFPQWLGKNSSANKYGRLLKDMHVHMKPRISGNKNELRQSYLTTLVKNLSKPLLDMGQDGIADVIKIMDHYYLDKDDWDSVIELQTGSDRVKDLLQSIPTPVKSAFTRMYNKSNHPSIVYINPTSKRAKDKAISTAQAALEIDDIIVAEDDTAEFEEESEAEDVSDDGSKKRKAPSSARTSKKTKTKTKK